MVRVHLDPTNASHRRAPVEFELDTPAAPPHGRSCMFSRNVSLRPPSSSLRAAHGPVQSLRGRPDGRREVGRDDVYVATIDAVSDGKYSVTYGDKDKGRSPRTTASHVRRGELAVGDKVVAVWAGAKMYPGVVQSKAPPAGRSSGTTGARRPRSRSGRSQSPPGPRTRRGPRRSSPRPDRGRQVRGKQLVHRDDRLDRRGQARRDLRRQHQGHARRRRPLCHVRCGRARGRRQGDRGLDGAKMYPGVLQAKGEKGFTVKWTTAALP